jgi:ribosome-associated translation inhibitor RaiA
MKITLGRAYELCSFLTVTPKQIGNVKDFAKIQRFRVALGEASGEFKKTLDEFQKWRAEEVRVYQEELKEFKSTPHSDDEVKAKEAELTDAYNEHIKDRVADIQKYELDNKDTEIDVKVNEEDMDCVKSHFEKTGHEFPYWATYPEAYSAIAKSLGYEL